MHKLSFKKNLNRFQNLHVKRKRLSGNDSGIDQIILLYLSKKNDSGIDQNISHFTIPTNLVLLKRLWCVCVRELEDKVFSSGRVRDYVLPSVLV